MRRRGPSPKTIEQLQEREQARRLAAIGSPLTAKEIRIFWSHVAKGGDDNCWLWTGTLQNAGYGTMNLRCRKTGKHRTYLAHRVSLWLRLGREPIRFAMHSCDTRRCCNPRHLTEGTQAENIGDAIAKGRIWKPGAKLTIPGVHAIRADLALGMYTQTTVAQRHGVTQATVSLIKRGKIWTDV
jgi:hypothetical protein